MTKRIAVTALLTTLMASAACAQSAPTDQPRQSPSAARPGDADGDGRVSRAEFLADAARRFDMMDADKDGQLTGDERRAARERLRAERPRAPGRPGFAPGQTPPGGPLLTTVPAPGETPAGAAPTPPRGGRGGMFARLDGNGDGKLTRAEFEAPFDRLDANRDGFVDQTEIAALRSLAGGGAPGGQGGGERLARLDTDGDGKISRAEYDRPFDRLDTDRNGVVDAGELAAVQGRIGGGRFGGNGQLRRESRLEPQ